MAFFPRLSYLSLYGGELHRKGGVLLKARLSEWERELQYLRFRIAEWKQFGSADDADYNEFRSFLLQKVRNHLQFELKVRLFFVTIRWIFLGLALCEPITIPSPPHKRTHVHAMRHTDTLDDLDGVRSRGAQRRRASAAELRR